jgi:hypothetical protein
MQLDKNTIIKILIVLLVLLIISLFFKSSNENFDNNINLDNIHDEINKQYDSDIDALRNLGAISKSLLTGTTFHNISPSTRGTLTIPSDYTVINGTLTVGGVNILDQINNLQTLINKYTLPKQLSLIMNKRWYDSYDYDKQYNSTLYDYGGIKRGGYEGWWESRGFNSPGDAGINNICSNIGDEKDCPNGTWITGDKDGYPAFSNKYVHTTIGRDSTKTARIDSINMLFTHQVKK